MATKEHESVQGLGLYFAENTSMHGVGRIVGKPGKLRRLFWTLAVLGGAGVAAYNIHKVIMSYMSWEVSTVVSLEYNSLLTFPAVTICNLNPAKQSKLVEALVKYAELEAITRDSETDTRGATNDTHGARNKTGLLEGLLDEDSDYPDWDTLTYDEDYFDTYDEDYNTRILFDKTYAAFPRDDQVAIGHNLSDMLLECSFHGFPCTPRNFTLSHNYMYGNCYTFNPSNNDLGTVTKSGPLYGFMIALYAEENEYESDLADSVGFKVVVHTPSKMPFPDNEGFVISPGLSTSVGVTKIEIERASSPYGECVRYHNDSEPPFNIFDNELPNLDYSDKACEYSCLQELLITECGCCNSKYPCTDFVIKNFTQLSPDDIEHCDFYKADESCALNVIEKFETLKSGCHERCPSNCFDESHQLEISSARWPANGKVGSVVGSIVDRAKKKGIQLPINESSTLAENKTFLSENVLKLYVYYKQLNYERIETKPAYDWSGLLSDLGGQAGLWLGFSLLTLGELLELLVDVIVTCFRKCCCRSPLQVNPVSPQREKW